MAIGDSGNDGEGDDKDGNVIMIMKMNKLKSCWDFSDDKKDGDRMIISLIKTRYW